MIQVSENIEVLFNNPGFYSSAIYNNHDNFIRIADNPELPRHYFEYAIILFGNLVNDFDVSSKKHFCCQGKILTLESGKRVYVLFLKLEPIEKYYVFSDIRKFCRYGRKLASLARGDRYGK